MISFQPTEDEITLVDTVRRFAQSRVRPAAARCEQEGRLPPSLVSSFWDLGLSLMNYSPEIGGSGLGQRATVLAEEELAWGDPTIAVALPRPGLAGDVISGLGMEVQSRWLAPFASAEPHYLSAALSERSPGEVTASKAGTGREDDGFLLSGQAYALSAARGADWVLVVALLDRDLALFAVSPGSDGFSVASDDEPLGLRGFGFGDVVLDHCALEAGNLLAAGPVARDALATGLQRDALVWAARLVGVSRAALEHAVDYAAERKTFGKPLAEHQVIAFLVADMGTSIEAARALLWHAAWAFDAGRAGALDLIASASAYAAAWAVSITSDAVQILGGHGYVQDHPVEKWLRDARTMANMSSWLGRLLASLAGGH